MLIAPVPGMSLTTEPGNRPWEQPPMYVKTSDVVNYYSEKLSDGEMMSDIMDVVKQNVPIYDIAQSFMKIGVMKGVHSVDVGFLVAPVVVEMIKSVAEINDIGYILTSKDKKEMQPIDKKIASEAIKEVVAASKNIPQEEGEMTEEEEVGFVSKRSKK